MALKIFFSHAWTDKEKGNWKFLLRKLEENYDVWIDKREILYGDKLYETFLKGLDESDIYLLVWSKHAANSMNVRKEIDRAVETGKRMIICKLDDCTTDLLPQLAGKKYADFQSEQPYDRETAWTRLHQFLLTMEAEKLPDSDDKQQIKSRLASLEELQLELDDMLYRRSKGVSGNDGSNEFIQGALAAFLEAFESPEDVKKRQFAEAAGAISEKYPEQKDDLRKKQLLLVAIGQIDPEQSEPELQNMAAYLREELAKETGETTEMAKMADPSAKEAPLSSSEIERGPVPEELKPYYNRLSNRQLLYLKTNSWGSGNTYTSSKHSIQAQLRDDGKCFFREMKSNYSPQTGTIPSVNEMMGDWWLRNNNGELMICFHWNNGHEEELSLRLSPNSADAWLNGVGYGIVDFNRQV